MRIAVCASEGAPYCKSGGLGDVMEALPAALSRIEGNEVALFLPYYSKVKRNAAYPTEKVAELRTVNHAKWLLIQHHHMTEQDAHYYIEKQAMDTRLSRREVADSIIRTYDK